jgi:hypothetical protein
MFEDNAQLDQDHIFPTFHDVSGEVYCRLIVVPAGEWLIGAVHQKSGFLVCLRGRATVSTVLPDLTQTRLVVMKSGDILKTTKGFANGGIAVEDCVFVTFHGGDGTQSIDENKEAIIDKEKTKILFKGLLPVLKESGVCPLP